MSITHTRPRVAAAVVAAALGLSACATSDSEGAAGSATSSSAARTKVVTLGYAQQFSAYNNATNEASALANTVVLNQVRRGFYYFGPDGGVVRDTDFGTFEKTSDNPLTVKYTFAAGAVWSDGEPVDCDDVVLEWLARSALTGEKGFVPASTVGYEQMKKPACKDGEKAFTIEYTKPFADWETVFASFSPAHVFEKKTGIADIIAAADKPKDPALLKAAQFWNTGWALNPGELKKDITLSAGPYQLDSWTAGQSLTLTENPKWWGKKPAAQSIVFRYIGDTAQPQALQNGEVDVIKPQSQTDLVNQLKALGDKVVVQTGDEYSYEHLDFNFAGAFKDRRLREAFAKCIPRQTIVDNLIKPQNPTAQVLQSRFIYPFQPAYNDYISGIGGEAYNTVDIAGAKALVEQASPGKKVTVRLGWRRDPAALNKRRVDTITLVQESCAKAGFDVKDTGAPDFFDKALPAGNFDVALFAWIGSPVVSGDPSIFQTKAGGKGGQNGGKYSNPEVDKLLDTLVTKIDKNEQLKVRKQVDTLLWKDLATIPLFALPALAAHGSKVSNVKQNATQNDITWNAFEWSKAAG